MHRWKGVGRSTRRPQTSNVSRVTSPFMGGQKQQVDSMDRFAVGEVIGKGSYAVVRLARDKTTTK